MDERENWIEMLDKARARLTKLVEHVEPMGEIYPGWHLKEFLSHMSGWDDACVDSIHAFIHDEPPDLYAQRGVDYYNALTVSTRETLPLEHVWREWKASRERFIKAARTLPSEKLGKQFPFTWGEVGNLRQMFGIFIHHETTHADELAEVLKKLQEK